MACRHAIEWSAGLLHGKEGVSGSSPEEGLKIPANERFVLSVLNRR